MCNCIDNILLVNLLGFFLLLFFVLFVFFCLNLYFNTCATDLCTRSALNRDLDLKRDFNLVK